MNNLGKKSLQYELNYNRKDFLFLIIQRFQS